MKKSIRTLKKLIICATFVMVALCLFACSKTPAAAIMEARDKMAALESVGTKVTADMKMNIGGQAFELSLSSRADGFKAPVKYKCSVDVKYGGITINMPMYIEQKDDGFAWYLGVDTGSGLQWGKTEAGLSEAAAGEDDGAANEEEAKQNAAEAFAMCADSFTQIGVDEINGKKTVHYDGVLTGQALNRALGDAVSQIKEALGSQDDGTLFKDSDDIPVSIWIEKDSGFIIKITMDAEAALNSFMENVFKQLGTDGGVTIGKADITIENDSFNAVTPFDIPKEALDAGPVASAVGQLLRLGEEDGEGTENEESDYLLEPARLAMFARGFIPEEMFISEGLEPEEASDGSRSYIYPDTVDGIDCYTYFDYSKDGVPMSISFYLYSMEDMGDTRSEAIYEYAKQRLSQAFGGIRVQSLMFGEDECMQNYTDVDVAKALDKYGEALIQTEWASVEGMNPVMFKYMYKNDKPHIVVAYFADSYWLN